MINLKSLRTLKALAICSLLSIPAVSNAQGCTAPPSDMVGWWPFDGNTDEIVLGYNGILQGGGTYNTGMVLQGYQSQSYTDLVEVPDNNDLDLGSEFSIDAWVKIDALNSDNMAIIWKGNSSGTDYTTPYSILVLRDNIPDAGKLAVVIGDGSSAQVIVSNSALSLQTQHLIAVVSDGQNVNIYINGNLDKTESLNVTPYNSSHPLQIGGVKNLASNKTNFFNGVIDEVEIFDRAITVSEIIKIYKAGEAGKCKTPCATPPSNMVGWWPFDGNANDIVLGNNGSIQGSGMYNTGTVLQGYQSQAYTDLVEVPDNNNLDLGAAFSIDAWVNINALNTDNMPIIWKGNQLGTDYTSPYSVIVLRGNIPDAGKVAVLVGNGSSAQLLISNNALSLQTPHLVAVVSDGQNLSIYIDGVLDISQPLTVTPYNSSYPLQIGGIKNLASNRTNYFNGVIDEVEIFNAAISQSDILSIYNAGSSGKCKGGVTASLPTRNRAFNDANLEVKVYPNPAQDQVTLEIDRKTLASHKSMKLQLIDNQGRTVKEINSIHSEETTIDIQELKGGVYIYQLLSNGQIITTGKLIK